ncbi:hypothetical protein [Halovivax sp.]|nr:hypothetical protein [Halovivax sp.]
MSLSGNRSDHETNVGTGDSGRRSNGGHGGGSTIEEGAEEDHEEITSW